MKNKASLVSSLDKIRGEGNVPLIMKKIASIPSERIIDICINVVHTFARGREDDVFFLAETISAIGGIVIRESGLPRNSGDAARIGGFVLYVFEVAGILRLELQGRFKKHATYALVVVDHDALSKLWEALPAGKTLKMPLFQPYAAWHTCTNDNSEDKLIKTNSKSVLSITAASHPIVFRSVNRAQEVGWRVNKRVLNTASWAFKEKQDAFVDIWGLADKEARASKVRETRTVISMANKIKGNVFYHRYYLDFRGRKYPATAYLHEQGSDLAGALLLREYGKPLGEIGYFWLRVCIASNWGGDSGHPDGVKTDKLPLNERAAWTDANEGLLLSYATTPRTSIGWMKADKPWKFLADCIELFLLREWQRTHAMQIRTRQVGRYDYVSSREGFIDGSNNGCQHLAALTRDEVTAPHVNLVPMSLPGDLYKYVGEHVWKELEKLQAEIPEEKKEVCHALLKEVMVSKWKISQTEPKSLERETEIARLRALRAEYADHYELLAPLFWNQITDAKHRRKIVKRGVMTIPYGGTKYGLGQQCIDDARKHGIELLNNMEHKWGAYMGRLIFEDCAVSLERPMRLLRVFEEAGRAAEERGEFLSWTLPITEFPVVQHYMEGTVKKVWVNYGPPRGPRLSTGKYENTLQVHICFKEIKQMSKNKQALGASPNIIHSLDAAHMMLTMEMCDFHVTTIHDSFGTLYCDMDKLYINVRRAFIRVYQQEPLERILNEIGGKIEDVDIGNLDLMYLLDSEYCFA